jgi:hypothetical protein
MFFPEIDSGLDLAFLPAKSRGQTRARYLTRSQYHVMGALGLLENAPIRVYTTPCQFTRTPPLLSHLLITCP